MAILDGNGERVLILDPRLIDDVHESPPLAHFQPGILPGIRKPVVKVELLAGGRRTFLGLHLQVVGVEIKHVDAIHFALPYKLGPILGG